MLLPDEILELIHHYAALQTKIQLTFAIGGDKRYQPLARHLKRRTTVALTVSNSLVGPEDACCIEEAQQYEGFNLTFEADQKDLYFVEDPAIARSLTKLTVLFPTSVPTYAHHTSLKVLHMLHVSVTMEVMDFSHLTGLCELHVMGWEDEVSLIVPPRVSRLSCEGIHGGITWPYENPPTHLSLERSRISNLTSLLDAVWPTIEVLEYRAMDFPYYPQPLKSPIALKKLVADHTPRDFAQHLTPNLEQLCFDRLNVVRLSPQQISKVTDIKVSRRETGAIEGLSLSGVKFIGESMYEHVEAFLGSNAPNIQRLEVSLEGSPVICFDTLTYLDVKVEEQHFQLNLPSLEVLKLRGEGGNINLTCPRLLELEISRWDFSDDFQCPTVAKLVFHDCKDVDLHQIPCSVRNLEVMECGYKESNKVWNFQGDVFKVCRGGKIPWSMVEAQTVSLESRGYGLFASVEAFGRARFRNVKQMVVKTGDWVHIPPSVEVLWLDSVYNLVNFSSLQNLKHIRLTNCDIWKLWLPSSVISLRVESSKFSDNLIWPSATNLVSVRFHDCKFIQVPCRDVDDPKRKRARKSKKSQRKRRHRDLELEFYDSIHEYSSSSTDEGEIPFDQRYYQRYYPSSSNDESDYDNEAIAYDTEPFKLWLPEHAHKLRYLVLDQLPLVIAGGFNDASLLESYTVREYAQRVLWTLPINLAVVYIDRQRTDWPSSTVRLCEEIIASHKPTKRRAKSLRRARRRNKADFVDRDLFWHAPSCFDPGQEVTDLQPFTGVNGFVLRHHVGSPQWDEDVGHLTALGDVRGGKTSREALQRLFEPFNIADPFARFLRTLEDEDRAVDGS
ncbi:hypothetical protein DICA2_C03906 [Diutina catenulata]